MADERRTATPGAETDASVTEAYRDLATERVPEQLDRAVLRKASAAARPRYSRLRAWTRPTAWAATVMLSVVLVLQMKDVTVPGSVDFDPATEIPEAGTSDRKAAEDMPVEMPEAEVLEEAPAAAPVRSLNSSSDLRDDAAVGRAAAKQVAPEPAPEKTQRTELLPEAAPEQRQAAPATDIDAFEPKDAAMLQRAAELARTQSGESNVSAQRSSVAEPAALGVSAVGAEAPACDESVRQTPETWLECITELEAAGLTDEALRQSELLQQTFPDFEAP